MSNLTWRFSHASFGNTAENHVTHMAEISINIPRVEEIRACLSQDGYMLNSEYKLYVYRSVSNNDAKYYIHCRIGFDKSDGRLMYQISSEYCDSIGDAVAKAQVVLSRCFYTGDIIAMGKGQLAQCKAIALRLAREHAAHLQESDVIVVSCESRGGRGGWKTKIADHRFSVNELRNPAVKVSNPAVMVVGNYYSDWRNMWLQRDEKVKIELVDGKVKLGHSMLAHSIDGDIVVLSTRNCPVFRFSIADWQRLLGKAQKVQA